MGTASFLAQWKHLPRGVRAWIAFGVPLLLGGMAIVFAFTHVTRGKLFATPLHPEQVVEVEERLASWHIAFTPSAHNLIVDRRLRSRLLLKLSLAGLPHSHVQTSREALGTLGALTPQAVVDAQTRSGLAGDIEVALRGIDGIDDARVIVAPAQSGIFADQRSQGASASVRLHLHPGVQLSHAQIDGIRQFVGAAVPGLQASKVTILDDRGVALGGVSEGADTQALQRSLQSALDDAFGAGSSIVRVRIVRDPHSIERRDVQHLPLGALTSTQETENYSARGKHYVKNMHRQESGSDVREVASRSPAGRIARLSVAIAVDARLRAQLPAIRALAIATTGAQPARGDLVSVEAVDFTRPLPPERDGWWLAYGAIVPLLPTLAIVVAVLASLRIAGAPLVAALVKVVERVGVSRTQAAVAGYSPERVRHALRDEPAHAAAAIISALPAATAAAVLELYPQAERQAILRRMQRERSSLIPDADEVIAHA